MQIDSSPLTWLTPPADLDWQADQVDVWRVSLQISEDCLESLETNLSADEADRAARFHFRADRDRFIAAHGSLRDILARYLRCEPAQLMFSTGDYGKPVLITNCYNPKIDFSLSHSGDLALVAVARERRIGVDVECIRQGISLADITRRYFSQHEVSELMALPPEHREVAFFNGWTRKEAYIKAQGLGLSLPLDSFDVSLDPNAPASLRGTRPDSKEAARWTLQNLEVGSGYAGALVSEGRTKILNVWDWNLEGYS